MELSLSTHLFVFHDLSGEILSLIPRFGFRLAELWAAPPHFPYADPVRAGEVLSGLASAGVRVASVHAPLYPDVRTYKKDRWYSLSSVEEDHRLASVEATVAAGRILERTGGGCLVLHTGFPAQSWYPHRWASFLSSVGELLERLPAQVRLAVENTPGPTADGDVLLDLANRFPGTRVGICLDVGHAHMEGNAVALVRKCGERLLHVHASDNRGDRDDHLVPGRGSVPWKGVVEALGEIGYGGAFTLELRDYTRGESPLYPSFEALLSDCGAALHGLFRRTP